MLCFTPNGHNPNTEYLASSLNPDMFEDDIITKLIDPSELQPFNQKELSIPTYYEHKMLESRMNRSTADIDDENGSELQLSRKDFLPLDRILLIYPKYEPSMRKIKIRAGSYFNKHLPYLNANNTIGSK